MKFYHVPVFLIGMFLTLIGLEVIFAPAAIIVTPANSIAFDTFGRVPLGIMLSLTGLATVYEGVFGSKHFFGLFAGILNSFFWFIVTLLPLGYGDEPSTIFGLAVAGSINSVSTLAWLLIVSLGIYCYLRRMNYWDSREEKRLLGQVRSSK